MKEACSIKNLVIKGWCIGAVTKQEPRDKVPKDMRQNINRFENFMDEEDEDEEIPLLEESEDEGEE
eukprot:6183171-Karenia_brevis.AAC.1